MAKISRKKDVYSKEMSMKLLRMSKMLCAYSACFALTLSGCLARSEEKKEAETNNEQIEIVVEESMDVETPQQETDTEKTEAPAEEKKEEVKSTERTTLPTPKEEKKMTKVVLPSGLAYEIITPAENENAATPVAGRKVTVNYTGWLDVAGQPGEKFDSSLNPGRTPFSFVIGSGYVIKGWDLGVMSMRVGEKRRLFIPSGLAYGPRGAGGIIGANANLIFDVELISVG
jgi:FKBP-type peptidyl-prolyl cis-trans isomerase